MKPQWPGWVWVKNTAENAGENGAGTAVAVITLSGWYTLHDVHWGYVAGAVGLAALVSVLKSVASLSVKNGTASVLPEVVAKPKHGTP